MEQMSLKKKLQVVKLYFTGLSFAAIAVKASVSKGSVVNIINELKEGNFPEAADVADQIETLRELSVDLAKLKMSVGKAAVGIAFLKRINEFGLDPADIERWPLLLNSIKTQDDAQELIEAAYAVRDIQQKSGLSMTDLEKKVNGLDKKLQELESVKVKINESKGQLQELSAQKQDLTSKVANLQEKFQWLIPRVQELEQREKSLLDRHKLMMQEEEKAEQKLTTLKSELKNLEKAGLSFQGLKDFAKKLKIVGDRHGLKPPTIRDRLLLELKHLNKGIGLETLVNQQKQILKDTNKSIDKRKGELESYNEALKGLQQQKQNLESVNGQLEKSVLINMQQILPAAQNMIQQLRKELNSGCKDALSIAHQLREESISVGQEIGQYEGVLKESRWVGKLMALLSGGEEVSPGDVRTIALSVNRGICAWLAQQGGKPPYEELLALNLGQYVRELEGWQPQG
ncbi:hypothetical protein ACFLT3_01160 [Chloroflexota bacterium]